LNIPVFEEDTLTFVTVDLYYPIGKLFSQEFEGTSPPSQEAVPIMATRPAPGNSKLGSYNRGEAGS